MRTKPHTRLRIGAHDPDAYDALQDPFCDTGLWWELAKKDPFVAMESPLFQLLTLEDPARWGAILPKTTDEWLDLYVETLVPRQERMRWAIECLERVLPIFPNKRVKESIRLRKSFADGHIPESAFEEKLSSFKLSISTISNDLVNQTVAEDKRMVCWAARAGTEEMVAHWASEAVKFHALYRNGEPNTQSPKTKAAGEAEKRWQWHRLLQYLGRIPWENELKQQPLPKKKGRAKKTTIGAMEDVRHPRYNSKIDWAENAKVVGMTADQLYQIYETACDPATPSEDVEALSFLYLAKSIRGNSAMAAICAALAQNPSNTTYGLGHLYGHYHDYVWQNPVLPLWDLEDPTGNSTRSFAPVLYELFQLGAQLFDSDGNRPGSNVVIAKTREAMALGFEDHDIGRLGKVLEGGDIAYAEAKSEILVGYFAWLRYWSYHNESPQWGRRGVAYILIHSSMLPRLLGEGLDISSTTAICNSKSWRLRGPSGSYPFVFASLRDAEESRVGLRDEMKEAGTWRRQDRLTNLIPVAIEVEMEEVQPLVNLGSVTGLRNASVPACGALRQWLPYSRILLTDKKLLAKVKSLRKKEAK